jgi:hypothetical protein
MHAPSEQNILENYVPPSGVNAAEIVAYRGKFGVAGYHFVALLSCPRSQTGAADGNYPIYRQMASVTWHDAETGAR